MYYYEYSQVGGSFGAELTAGSGPDVVLNVPLALRSMNTGVRSPIRTVTSSNQATTTYVNININNSGDGIARK